MLIFYGAGRLLYDSFYRWTLSLIITFSDNNIRFFGKVPFWFFGNPYFGLVFCSIPLTIWLCYLLLKGKDQNAFRWTLICYLPLFFAFYLLNCYSESVALLASNDFYRTDQPLLYNLRQVNINRLTLISIVMTTILTAIIDIIKRFRIKKRQPIKKP